MAKPRSTKVKNEKPKVEMVLNIILDESGSMSCVRDKTVEGINEYVGGLIDDKNADYLVTLTKFDLNGYDPACRVQYKMKPLKNLKPMELTDYMPRGSTPLLDAVGQTIRMVEKEVDDHAVLTVIITDGFENASREFKNEQIKKLIEEKQNTGKWTFVYLGADQNAWANASNLGVPIGNTMSYQTANTESMYKVLSATTKNRAYNMRSFDSGSTVQCFADAGLSNKSLEDNLTDTGKFKSPRVDITTSVQVAVSNKARAGGVKRAMTQTPEARSRLAQEAAKARWKDRNLPGNTVRSK